MDEIRRRLALIDRQLAGWSFHRQVVVACPLVFVAVGLMAGIWTQGGLSEPLQPTGQPLYGLTWAVIAAVAAGSGIVLFILQLRGKISSGLTPVVLGTCAAVCSAGLGAARLARFQHTDASNICNALAGEPLLATIRGSIISDPRISDNTDWVFGRFKPGDPSSSFYLKVTEAQAKSGWVAAKGTVRVQVGGPVLDLRVGDQVQAYCWLEKFEPASNPGQFDVARYLARRRVFVAASVQSRDGITLLSRPERNVFTRARTGLRKAASEALLGDLPGDESGRGLVQALLLGYRGDIDAGTYQAFRKTGLLHFISLSGMHLGILIGIVWWAAKVLGLLRPGRAVVCIVAVAVFLLVVPARAPTLRAAIICWTFCLSILFRRHSNSVNTLALAAIVLLILRPTHLFEAGWQLSFSTVLGILLLERPIEILFRGAASGLFSGIRVAELDSDRALARVSKAPLQLLSTGLAAWLGGAGVLLYHFGSITPLAFVWTVLVFPFVALILTFGFLKIILYFGWPTVSVAIGYVISILSEAMIWAVRKLAFLDMSDILIGGVPLALVILYYCLVTAGFFWYPRRPVLKRALCSAGFVLLALSLGFLRWNRTHPGELILTCLDVGHGQCVLAQFPDGRNVMFDAGSLHISNPGGRIITPFLQRAGIGRIDAIVLSHNDVDHLNGIPEVMQAVNVDAVYANETFFGLSDEWGTARCLRDYLEGRGIQIKPIGSGLEPSEDVSLEVIWPTDTAGDDAQLSENDRSAVCLIRFGQRKVLVCSDIERYAQQEIIRIYPELKADVVIAPHHGSTRTSDPTFMSRLAPAIVINSCSRSDDEQAKVWADQEHRSANGTDLFYTDRDGAITVSVSREGHLNVSRCVAQKK